MIRPSYRSHNIPSLVPLNFTVRITIVPLKFQGYSPDPPDFPIRAAGCTRRANHGANEDYGVTKGKQIQIDTADRFSRETLEKRPEETPSNARCFAQGSSLMC
jgi:hypothetical protein